jgi:hypothetical protein
MFEVQPTRLTNRVAGSVIRGSLVMKTQRQISSRENNVALQAMRRHIAMLSELAQAKRDKARSKTRRARDNKRANAQVGNDASIATYLARVPVPPRYSGD